MVTNDNRKAHPLEWQTALSAWCCRPAMLEAKVVGQAVANVLNGTELAPIMAPQLLAYQPETRVGRPCKQKTSAVYLVATTSVYTLFYSSMIGIASSHCVLVEDVLRIVAITTTDNPDITLNSTLRTIRCRGRSARAIGVVDPRSLAIRNGEIAADRQWRSVCFGSLQGKEVPVGFSVLITREQNHI